MSFPKKRIVGRARLQTKHHYSVSLWMNCCFWAIYIKLIIQMLREPMWEMCTNLTFTCMIDREGPAPCGCNDDNGEPKMFP